jgi:hypothetical protein
MPARAVSTFGHPLGRCNALAFDYLSWSDVFGKPLRGTGRLNPIRTDGSRALGCGVVSGFVADKLKIAFGRPPPDAFLTDGHMVFISSGAASDSILFHQVMRPSRPALLGPFRRSGQNIVGHCWDWR